MMTETKKVYTKPEKIREKLNLSSEETRRLEAITSAYPMAVTDYYLSLINPSDKADPIRKMCIPAPEEADEEGRFDTSGEADNTVALGLQYKYPATVLLLSTNRCAMYCRHCFRKRLVGVTEDEIANNLKTAADYIAQHKEVSNILISGGDFPPLCWEKTDFYRYTV